MRLEQSTVVHSASGHEIDLELFGQQAYAESYQEMQAFSKQRDDTARDRIWLIEHPQVYTQGTACEQQTLLPTDIDVVKTDRGGQITFHGPGQLVMYPLLNLRHFGIGVKTLVNALEQSVINTLADFELVGQRRDDAPGVYIDGAKIAALGLRIRRGNSYHGLSFNLDMDLTPFNNIDPCGYQGLQVTQLSDLVDAPVDQAAVGRALVRHFTALI